MGGESAFRCGKSSNGAGFACRAQKQQGKLNFSRICDSVHPDFGIKPESCAVKSQLFRAFLPHRRTSAVREAKIRVQKLNFSRNYHEKVDFYSQLGCKYARIRHKTRVICRKKATNQRKIKNYRLEMGIR